MENHLIENRIAKVIVGAAIKVHNCLGGPGLLEGVYEEALCHELTLRGCPVKRQIQVPISYKGKSIASPLRLDLLVADKVIIEVKATEADSAIHQTQLLTYLRLSQMKLGMLLNFGKRRIVDGISRIVNGL